MNPIELLLSEPFGQSLGWTLLHFVWQGALVALVLAAALHLLRHSRASTRYAVSCGAMAMLLALPLITLTLLLPSSAAVPDGAETMIAAPLGAPAEASVEAHSRALPEATATWQQEASSILTTALPWLVLLWMAGVFALSLRYLAGWTYTIRLRRRGVREVGQQWHEQLARLAEQLGVRRVVRLVASARVQVPTVAGWLRPVILMPVSVFTGLTPRQVEMIIAHELAHIRRHDYLINLLQATCETVLFYHPAVWWVSQRIRVEREHCCDDLVVSVCGDAFTYVAALAQMEEVRQAPPRLALAASGGSLLNRIRRLLDEPAEASPRAARWLTGFAILAIFLLSLHLSSAFDGLWNKTQTLAAETETHEILPVEEEGRLFIHTTDERGVFVESIKDGQTNTFTLKGPDIEMTIPAGTRLTIDAEEGPEKGLFDAQINTLTFKGDLTLETSRGDLQRNRMSMREATVVYALPQEQDALADTWASLRQLLPKRDYEQTATRLEQLIMGRERESVQLDALDELRALPQQASFPALINIAERHPRRSLRLEAVQWLGRLGDAYIVFALEDLAFEDRSAAVQMEALDALRNLPEKVGIPSLIKIARTHPRAMMRNEAVQWLGRLGDNTARLILEQILYEDADAAVQLEALDALDNLPRGISLELLRKVALAHPNEAVRRKARDQQERQQQQNWEDEARQNALAQRMQPNPSWSNHIDTAKRLEALIFKDESEAVQTEALDALANLSSKIALPILENIVENHGNEQIRRLAAQHSKQARQQIRTDEATDDTWAQALKDLKHPSTARRIDAIKAMEAIRTKKITGVMLRVAFDDASQEVQMEALDVLRDRGGLEAMAGVARIIRTHPSAALRQEAVQSMDRMDINDQLEVLAEVLSRDRDPRVQQEALDALADLKDQGGRAILKKIAQAHASARIRGEANEALRSPEGTTFSDRMMAALNTSQNHPDAEARAEAVQTLREWSSVNVITILADIAYDDPSLAVQMEALDALQGRGDWDGTSWVIHIARNHPAAAMRVEAVGALEEMDTKTLLPLLEEIIFRDKSLEVQMEALEALKDLPYALRRPILVKISEDARLPQALRNAVWER